MTEARTKEVRYFSLNIDKGEEWHLRQFPQDSPGGSKPLDRIAIDGFLQF